MMTLEKVATIFAFTGFSVGPKRHRFLAELSQILVLRGRRVLVIDADGSGDIGREIKAVKPTDERGLCDVVWSQLAANKVVGPTQTPGLDYVPAGYGLKDADEYLDEHQKEPAIAFGATIRKLAGGYDHVLISTSNDRSLASTFCVLAGATAVIVLTPEADDNALDAPKELKDADRAKSLLNPLLVVAGIVGTGAVDKRGFSNAVDRALKMVLDCDASSTGNSTI